LLAHSLSPFTQGEKGEKFREHRTTKRVNERERKREKFCRFFACKSLENILNINNRANIKVLRAGGENI
jgi:hypothetical protein